MGQKEHSSIICYFHEKRHSECQDGFLVYFVVVAPQSTVLVENMRKE